MFKSSSKLAKEALLKYTRCVSGFILLFALHSIQNHYHPCHKAIWNGEVIALKQLTIDMSTTVESLGFEFEEAINPLDVFKEFRAEVLLMRYEWNVCNLWLLQPSTNWQILPVIHSDMVHPNIMAVKGLCMNPFCMLLEFCSLGSLYDYLHNKVRLPELG